MTTTFVEVGNSSLLLSNCFGKDSGEHPTSPLQVTELSFHNCVIRIYQNYSLQPPNDLKLLANSFCLISLGKDPGQCCSTKPTGRHVACNPSCPTTSYFLSVIHKSMQGPANQHKHHNLLSLCDFFHHSGEYFTKTQCAALSSHPLHLRNGVLP